MALRIGSKSTPPAPPAEDEVDEAASVIKEMPVATDVEPLDDGMPPRGTGGMVDPAVARYLGPESRCNNCVHFMEPSSCEIVAGPIDPEGVCSLHTTDTPEDAALDTPQKSDED